MRLLLTCCFLLSFMFNLTSQCAYTGVASDIPDLDTTVLSIVVDEVVANNLATNNCVEAVKVHFNHTFICDLTMELVSPSGQSVQLLGPITLQNNGSSMAQFNVTFIESDAVAVPDGGYQETWNNDQTWLGNFLYSGTYYPNQGRLEDFDTGPVNGEWKLVIIDHQQFSEGEISHFELFFCDPEGQKCKFCSPIDHTLEEADVLACEEEPILDLIISPSFIEPFDSVAYGYGFMSFRDNVFLEYLSSPDLTSYSPGTYTICGVNYFLTDENAVQTIQWTDSLQFLDAAFANEDVCANLSSDCIEIIIQPNPLVITDIQNICEGDSIVVNGISYKEEGVYEIITQQEPCDSMSILDLRIKTIFIDIAQEFAELSCDNYQMELDASGSDIPQGSQITWTASDGSIISNPDSTIVSIDKVGTYIFEIDALDCIVTKEVIIVGASDYTFIELESDIISCATDSVFIDLSSSDLIINTEWSGPTNFSFLDEDIRVGSAGVFEVVVETANGCITTRNITIEDIRELPVAELTGGTLSCPIPEVIIGSSDISGNIETYHWSGPSGELGSDPFISVTLPGEYKLVTTTELGCKDSFFIDIPSIIDTFNVSLISDTITCESNAVTIAFESDLPGLNSIWTLPNNTIKADSAFISSQSGVYQLTVESPNNCLFDTTLLVLKDSLFPEIFTSGGSFLCGEDSVQIFASSNAQDISFNWTGPGINTTNPDPFVISPGNYILEGCLPNGCCVYDTIFVDAGNNIPSLSFQAENIGCESDTTYIIPSDTTMFDFDWSFDNNPFIPNSNIVTVTNPGLYQVTVTDPNNGCFSKHAFFIQVIRVDSLTRLESGILNCANDATQFNVVAPLNIIDHNWDGPGLLNNNVEASINLPGEYIFDYTFSNGCSGSDTILVELEGELPNLTGENVVLNCFADSVIVSVEHEASSIAITWDGPGPFTGTGASIEAYEAGIYTAYALAPGDCRDTLSITVVGDTLRPTLGLVSDGEITCASPNVVIDASVMGVIDSFYFEGPGIIEDDDQQITVNVQGEYTITAVGINGCLNSASIFVDRSTDLPDYTVLLDSLNCVTSQVDVGIDSPDENLSIVWDGPQAVADDTYIFTASVSGVYNFILTNTDGCIVEDSFLVFRDTLAPPGSIIMSSQITCTNDEATFTIENYEPDWDITWSGPGIINPADPMFTTNEIGIYTLEIIDENGCVSNETQELIYDTLSPVIEIIGEDINCEAGKTFLRIESDLPLVNYDWTGLNFTSSDVEPLIFEAGEYFVTVTAENGCLSSGSIVIEDNRDYPEIEVEDYYLPCDGSPIEVTYINITEGSEARWYGENFSAIGDTIDILAAGEYYAIAFNPEGCTFSDTFYVIDEPIYPEFSGSGGQLLCFGPIELTAFDVEDDKSLVWDGPDDYISVENPAQTEIPGEYNLIVTGINGCVDTLVVEVFDGRIEPDVAIGLDAPFQCKVERFQINGDGSSEGPEYSYQWTAIAGNIIDDATSLRPTIEGEGIYVLTVYNSSNGCSSSDTLMLEKEPQSLVGLDIEGLRPSCEGFANGTITIQDVIGGFGPFQVFVDDNSYGERMEINYLAAGEHEVLLIDALGCEYDTLVTLPDSNFLLVEVPNDTILDFGDELNIFANINFNMDSIESIQWTNDYPCTDCIEEIVSPVGNQIVSVTVTDIFGCVITKEFRITLDRPNKLPFPQIFSPNGDDTNDVFYFPMTKGMEVIDFVRIYDTWGGLLYTQQNLIPGDPTFGWNGKFEGQDVGQAVYLVHAMVTLTDGQKISYIGDLTVIR